MPDIKHEGHIMEFILQLAKSKLAILTLLNYVLKSRRDDNQF